MTQDKLKPCPFCGAHMNLSDDGDLVAWHKHDCFFILLEEDELDLTDEEIKGLFIEAWNRRSDNGA